MRFSPRRSNHSTSGLNVPANTSATTSSRTTARSCRNNHTPTIVARIHAIERGEISKRTRVVVCAGPFMGAPSGESRGRRGHTGAPPPHSVRSILVPAASAAGVTGLPAVFIIRAMAVVRVAGVTALGPVADALIALVFVLVTIVVIIITVAAANASATDDRGAGERHVTDSSGSRPCIPVEGATGRGDRRPGQDVALERRGRHGRGRVNPPRDIARLRAAG